ncbi:MAG: hypothetical protein N2445_02565, partial [Acidobacteria bacterium]|nr:hypothetical protein [Acidobacteriota bacterium]
MLEKKLFSKGVSLSVHFVLFLFAMTIFLFSVSIFGGGAKSSYPTISSDNAFSKQPNNSNPNVNLPNSESSRAVLWDQPLSSVNTNAYVDQDFADFPEYSSYLADDFTNTETWTITSIFVPGDGWNGFSSLYNAE